MIIALLIKIISVNLKFTIDQEPRFTFFGKQVKAKERTTFVPGLFTQLLVTICQELNVSERQYFLFLFI